MQPGVTVGGNGLTDATASGSDLLQARLRTFEAKPISDSYSYLLGRLAVTRQQQLDFNEGFKWNELVHRQPGAVDWPNPNLDVAYSEAWVAVDENCYLLVTVCGSSNTTRTAH